MLSWFRPMGLYSVDDDDNDDWFLFFTGLNDALHRNPELCPSVMDILLDHFNQFYEPDENILPPLLFSKTVVLQGADAVLQVTVYRKCVCVCVSKYFASLKDLKSNC